MALHKIILLPGAGFWVCVVVGFGVVFIVGLVDELGSVPDTRLWLNSIYYEYEIHTFWTLNIERPITVILSIVPHCSSRTSLEICFPPGAVVVLGTAAAMAVEPKRTRTYFGRVKTCGWESKYSLFYWARLIYRLNLWVDWRSKSWVGSRVWSWEKYTSIQLNNKYDFLWNIFVGLYM